MKKKILTLRFQHETNVSSPKPADRAAFQSQSFEFGMAALDENRGKGTELGAFIKVMEERTDIELIPAISFNATPSGRVTEDIYNLATETVIETITKKAPFDGVLIDFHGAMVSEGHSDGEGDLLEVIRELVGWDIPVIASLDLHANVTPKMSRCADALIPYENYPHTDDYETGLRAAQIMLDTLDGKIKPVMAYRHISHKLQLFMTDSPKIRPIYEKAHELENSENAVSVRFSHGFFPAEIDEVGLAVLAITDNDKELAERIADELAETIKNTIPNLKEEYMTLDEVLDRAMLEGDGPVVIGDASDNPGAGAVGDTTHILRKILERGITGAAVATILDPESVEKCIEAGVGETVKLSLGGKSDPKYSGGPLAVDAYVKMITDGKYIFKGKMMHGSEGKHGKTAVVEIRGNTVLITSKPRQPLDLEIFRSHGITPEEQRLLVTKSTIHYRASYGEVAREMHTVVVPGYASPFPPEE